MGQPANIKMRKYWKRIVLCSVGGLLLAAVSSVATMQYLECPHYGGYLLNALLRRSDHVDPRTEFHLFLSTTESGPKGVTIDGYTYRATDCIRVFNGFYKFDSVSEAEDDIRQKVGGAYHVYDHTTKLDGSGDAVLERATLKFTKGGEYFIFRRRGRKVNEIISESLAHAVLFEQRYMVNK